MNRHLAHVATAATVFCLPLAFLTPALATDTEELSTPEAAENTEVTAPAFVDRSADEPTEENAPDSGTSFRSPRSSQSVRGEGISLLNEIPMMAPSAIANAFPVGNWDVSGLADVARVESNGDLTLFPHTSSAVYGKGQRIGVGWNVMRAILGGADFNGDGHTDVVAINRNHEMFLYQGTGGGFGNVRKIGTGWHIFDQVLMLERGPGGQPAIYGVGSGGDYVYTTNGRGSWTGRSVATVPDLSDAIAGPDLWGSGYSTIIVKEAARSLAVYSTSNGVDFYRRARITPGNDVSLLINAGIINSTQAHIDVVMRDGSTVSFVVASADRGAVAPPPSQPSAPEMPALWSGASFGSVTQAGTGWPHSNVYSMGDFDGDGHNDAAIMWNDGRLVLYPSYSQGKSFGSTRQIGVGWNALKDFHTGIDFDGDTRPDIVARMYDGDLRLYPGNGRGGFEAVRRIGTGWSGFDSIKVVRQGPGGKPAVVAVSGDTIRVYSTDGRGNFHAGHSAYSGHSWVNSAVASDDWNNDGLSDLIYRAHDGMLYVALQNSQGFSSPLNARIGNGWNGFTALIPAYFSAGVKSLWVVALDGKLKVYSWNSRLGAGSFTSPQRVIPSTPARPAAHTIVNRSYQDGPWLKHPIQWKGQPDDESCGPTSMWMVLNYLGAQRSAYDGKALDVWTLKGRDYANVGTGWSGGTSWEEKRLSVGMNRWLGQNAYSQWSFPNGWDFRVKVIDSFKTGRPVVVDTIENYGGPHYNGHVGTSSHIVVVNEYHSTNGSIGFIDPGGPGSAISGYSAQRTFRYPSAIDFGNNFLGNYGGGGHGMVY